MIVEKNKKGPALDLDLEGKNGAISLESPRRKLQGKVKTLTTIVLFLFSVIVGIYTNSYGFIQSTRQIGLFVGFSLFLTFVFYPFNNKSSLNTVPIIDWVLAILGAMGGLYTFYFVESFARMTIPTPNNFDIFFGVTTIVLILEATRRAAGKWISIICIFFLVYAYFGSYFPRIIAHSGFTLERILIRMYLVDEGIYGITGRVATTYIFVFIIFGAFLKSSGISNFFNNLAIALAGKTVGGPAKVAVISSAITGTITGSGVANVLITGAITIPLMIKMGYKKHFAGAVEAAASTGGLIMPPVMGSTAFIMAEFLGVSYLRIIVAAIIPALLYYFCIFSNVHYEALKSNLKGMLMSDSPKLKDLILSEGYLILPLIIIVVLLVLGYTIIFCAFFATASTVLLSQFKRKNRMGLKKIFNALIDGAESVLSVGIACVACGMIIGVMGMTGIGQVIAYNIVRLSGGVLFIALMLMMFVAIFMSMGLPGSVTYIVVVTACAPAVIMMGVEPFVAHFFVFFFGCLSNLTPPVALASYAAAGIADANPSKVAWTGLRLMFPVFFVPYAFVYSPMLLARNIEFPHFLIIVILTLCSLWTFSLADRGFYNNKLTAIQRIWFFILSITFLLVTNASIFISLSIIAVLIITIIWLNKHKLKEIIV